MVDITKASTFAVIDELGFDPLRDRSFDAIHSVTAYTFHKVAPEEQHNAPLLAYNVYLNEDYWRVILVYNNIADMFALKEGMRIKIPALSMIATRLTGLLNETQTASDTVRI